MSNHLAIATVTATLRRTLQALVQDDVASAVATSLRPDAPSGLPDPGVNVYLYQVTPNAALRNGDLPTRDSRGNVVQRPRVALDLHYLLTFYGDEATLEPQRVLGSAARALHARPYITRASIGATLADPLFAFLAGSDLAEEIELVKLTPAPFTLEEMSKLWSFLLETPYRLSMAYLGTVVLIEAEETPRRALPVREPHISVFPFRRAVLERVVSAEGSHESIELADTILLQGSQLGGAVAGVRVGAVDLPPVAGSVNSSEIRVVLADPGLRAGVQRTQVVYQDGTESTIAAFVLHPRVTVGAPVTATRIPITFSPEVGRDQRVELYLNELSPPTGRDPRAYSFEAPGNNGISDPSATSTAGITFAISGVEADTYLVRVRVDGAESVLEVDESEPPGPTFGHYIGPTAAVPAA